MPFTFKQFYIDDTQCAMKVGTDSILLGSWSCAHSQQQVLDIGTGSGLLAIMLAQKLSLQQQPFCIHAVELDADAASQATSNVEQCPWSDCIHVYQQSIQAFVEAQGSQQKYDLILSNPPYFVAGQEFEATRQQARHTGQLSWFTLLANVASLLSQDGYFECVIPADGKTKMLALAQQFNLSLVAYCCIKTKAQKSAKRVLLRFRLNEANQPYACEQTELVIHAENGQYSCDFRALCSDFYLNF
ncbi:hypothetical protein C2869_02735 [Saccharobesus litoralis]|uniref:tRNA1(Val) (adenine(37)-N6)-methyltransferase n=1 Tax=Saccharobesus litoralis TaxID=2172099 RepID=A0A2S0VMH1_9ALTE|nr:methyltransferase [Saccharobesus litoralis]AWB65417.1 hypothetical protein C2869_02735 [Saccharobesus litoralis]